MEQSEFVHAAMALRAVTGEGKMGGVGRLRLGNLPSSHCKRAAGEASLPSLPIEALAVLVE